MNNNEIKVISDDNQQKNIKNKKFLKTLLIIIDVIALPLLLLQTIMGDASLYNWGIIILFNIIIISTFRKEK
ncbi:MAG TPA: hypothetical protein PK737_01155 [Bacilli bacterium]|nr:hypothetical protein [Bacilli bacterium]